jgi:DNA invertase Pin-like site-specific DNA recombinase
VVETLKAVGRAIYARLSQDRGKLSENVDIQIEEAREYFAGQGWPVDERLIFSDNDISASLFSDKERPGWLDLLAAIRAGAHRADQDDELHHRRADQRRALRPHDRSGLPRLPQGRP